MKIIIITPIIKTKTKSKTSYWALESEFRGVTLWEHDFAPPLDHCFHRVAEWCALAKAVSARAIQSVIRRLWF